MVWEARTKSVGNLMEVNLSVAHDGENFSWTGQLMMQSNEWRDFTSQLGLRDGDGGVWRSD